MQGKRFLFATGWVLCLGLSAQAEPATPAGKQPTADFHVAASGVRGEEKMTPKDVYAPIDIQQIKMGGELGRRMDITVSNNLLKIDMDKIFLAPFRGGPNIGFSDGGPYVGLGKTLESMVRLAAATGNETLLARKKMLAEQLIKTQDPEGYIGCLPPDKRTWYLWDLAEQAYVIMALVADYQLLGNRDSLTAAQKLGDYIIKRWSDKPADLESKLGQAGEFMSEVGLDCSFLALHAATRDPRYLDFTAKELGLDTWSLKIVQGRPSQGKVEGHTYTCISRCLAQSELYRLRPDAALLASTRRAVDFMTGKDGMTISGGVGQSECWADDQKGRDNLGETCSTVHQILLFDSLLRMEGDARWGDLLERNLYNALFGAQSPDGRNLRYYVPFEGKRVYFPHDGYCCPCNYRRMIGYLPQLIYYRAGQGVAVDLYSTSEVTLDNVGGTTVKIRQETDYPAAGRVALQVGPQKPAVFPLLLRIPRWCTNATVSVNGKPNAGTAKSGEFLKLDRKWQSGDKVTLDMAMPWRFVAGRKTQAGRAAVMRGPMVYTLNPARITITPKTESPKAEPTIASAPVGLDLLANYLDWPLEQNRTRGKPMKIGAKEYPRGLFCVGGSKVIVHLPGPGKSFSAVVGVDANNDAGVKGSVVFKVSMAGKQPYASPVLRGKAEGLPVTVDLGGAREFTLEVGDAGDGIDYDWACWAEAAVTLDDGTVADLGTMPVRDLRPTPLVTNAAPNPDLRRLVLLPETAELVADDASVRPGGAACRIKADLDKADKGAYTLILTEFPDPDGQATFFLLPDPKAAVNDELLRSDRVRRLL